jgi:BirA family biotin operon repressor/biotin-[acetyl-CoA-carboxylase] ligase
VAVAEALARVAPVAPRLKWPNDVLVGSRKVAGILLETRLGRGPVVTVLGIGVNLAQRRFVGGLADRATSVAIETGLAVDRETLLTVLLDTFEAWRRRLEAEGFDVVRRRWIELSDTLGRPVTVDGASGVALDVDADGALILDTAGGRHRVLAGTLET